MYVPFFVFCVLFVCKCVLYCCYLVSTLLRIYIINILDHLYKFSGSVTWHPGFFTLALINLKFYKI
jgi:hypothetical protein